MALETGTFISDLVVTNPTGSDALAFADDHLRLLKNTLKSTFPSVTGAVTKTHTEINALASQTDLTNLQTTLTAAIAAAVAAAKLALYPVGSTYTNATNATNPATLLGFGTWVAFGAGRVPVGFDATNPLFDTAEETGGTANAITVSHTHTGTTASAGNHQHLTVYNGGGYGGSQYTPTVYSDQTLRAQGGGGGYELYTLFGTTAAADGGLSSVAGAHTHSVTTDSTGVSGTNANYQPYITVYIWKRTA